MAKKDKLKVLKFILLISGIMLLVYGLVIYSKY